MVLRSLSVALLALAACARDLSSKRTLVLVDNMSIKSTHSLFFKNLDSRGHKLTFYLADDPGLVMVEYGEYLYDNMVIFAPSVAEFGGLIDVPSILEFIDSGNNLLVAVDSSVSDPIREVASECGVDFDEEETAVIDHLNFDASDVDGDHTLILANNFVKSDVILPKTKGSTVLFRGIGQAVDEDNALVIKVLTGSPTAYSSHPQQPIVDYPQSAARDTLLVTALQARNNARVAFSGSLELFSNEFFNKPAQKAGATASPKSGNADFGTDLTSWVFQERGMLKIENVKHHRKGETTAPAVYRIKDDTEYSCDILEWKDGAWTAFKGTDVQVDFTMLDPFVRTTLKSDGKGHFSADVPIPDVYGVFKYRALGGVDPAAASGLRAGGPSAMCAPSAECVPSAVCAPSAECVPSAVCAPSIECALC